MEGNLVTASSGGILEGQLCDVWPGAVPDGAFVLVWHVENYAARTVVGVHLTAKRGPHLGDGSVKVLPDYTDLGSGFTGTLSQVSQGVKAFESTDAGDGSFTPSSNKVYGYCVTANGMEDLHGSLLIE